MKKSGFLLATLFLLFALPVVADTVYVSGQSVVSGSLGPGGLYTFDTFSNAVTLIALTNLSTTGGNVPLYDVAINSTGQMYGVDANGQFYSVNFTTGVLTAIGSGTLAAVGGAGNPANALTFNPANGTLWAAGGSTVGTVNPLTGAFTSVGSGVCSSSGDLEFAAGTLYLTAHFAPSTDELCSINTSSGAATLIGLTGGWEGIQGLAFDTNNSTMYGFTSPHEVVNVNLSSPNSTSLIVDVPTVSFLGATIQTAVTPEPAAISLFGFGVLLLSVLLIRSRRQGVIECSQQPSSQPARVQHLRPSLIG